MNKCVFLDRDGVINQDNPNYTFRVDDFAILPGVIEALGQLKKNGYLRIIITNQSGIAQGLYTQQQMEECHRYFQEKSGGLIDQFYFSPDHPSVSASLSRKPGTLMFEKAIAKFNIDINQSWMVGDRGRDILPARKLGLKTIQVGDEIPENEKADYQVESLLQSVKIILSSAK
ncbi:MAG: HAD family hydrolase [Cyclobacteriaceae bacterium]